MVTGIFRGCQRQGLVAGMSEIVYGARFVFGILEINSLRDGIGNTSVFLSTVNDLVLLQDETFDFLSRNLNLQNHFPASSGLSGQWQ